MSKEIQFNARFQEKFDTHENWLATDIVLKYAERVLVKMNTGEIREKVGDGVSKYSELEFTDKFIKENVDKKFTEFEEVIGNAFEMFGTIVPSREELYPNGELAVMLNTCAEHMNGNGTIDDRTIYGDCMFGAGGHISEMSTNVNVHILGPIKFRANAIGDDIMRININGETYEITDSPFEFEGTVKENFTVMGPHGTDLYFEYFVIDNKKLFFNETNASGSNINNGTGEKSLQQVLDTDTWNTSNETVKEYVKNSIPGANNGLRVNGIVNGDTVTIDVGAFGKLSTMMNGKSQTIGGKSHAEGSKTIALENNSHAEGNDTFAAGAHSHAEGSTTSAIGNASHAEGEKTIAAGNYSHSEGTNSQANGQSSHAEGRSTTGVNAQYSHAEGYGTVANGAYQHVSGMWNELDTSNPNNDNKGTYAVIVGNGTEENPSNAYTLDWNGNATFAGNIKSSGNATINGDATFAGNIKSSGDATFDGAINTSSTIHTKSLHEGSNNSLSHGSSCVAAGTNSHAEGNGSKAGANGSHAEGKSEVVEDATYAHTEGYGTKATGAYSHVLGTWNEEDTNTPDANGRRKYAQIVGNGETENARSNAYTLDWDGNATFAGTIKTKNIDDVDAAIIELQNKDVEINLPISKGSGEKSLQQELDTNSWNTSNKVVKEYVTNLDDEGNLSPITTADGKLIEASVNGDTVTINVGAHGKLSTMMNGKSQTVGGKSHAEGSKTIAFENNSHAEGNETFAAGKHSHAEGNITSAIGNSSHSEGGQTIAFGEFTHAEGYETKAIGNFSHAEGVFTEARGEQSHVEGNKTKTGEDAPNAHAEGYQTHALASTAHAEGKETIASGMNSHAEGYNNVASGVNSHVEGSDNEAFSDNSHVEGWDNTIIENANYSHAEGVKNTIHGIISHAEGSGNLVHSNYAHAEGSNHDIGSIADYAHVEGIGNSVDGYASHVEGGNNSASGPYNHVNGFGNVSSGEYQTVIGRANQMDDSKAFIIGNGEINSDFTIDSNKRKNAMTVDWDGNAYFAGNVYIGKEKLLATTEEVDAKIAALVDSSPETLNTLNELAEALGNDENFAATTAKLIGEKADADSVYNKIESDTLLENKAFKEHNHQIAKPKGYQGFEEIDRDDKDYFIDETNASNTGTIATLFSIASEQNPFKVRITGKSVGLITYNIKGETKTIPDVTEFIIEEEIIEPLVFHIMWAGADTVFSSIKYEYVCLNGMNGFMTSNQVTKLENTYTKEESIALPEADSIILKTSFSLTGDELIGNKNKDTIYVKNITKNNEVEFSRPFSFTDRYFGYVGVNYGEAGQRYMLVVELELSPNFDLTNTTINAYYQKEKGGSCWPENIIIGKALNGRNYIMYSFVWDDDKPGRGIYFDSHSNDNTSGSITLHNVKLYKQSVIQNNFTLGELKDWKKPIYQNSNLVQSTIDDDYILTYSDNTLFANSLSDIIDTEIIIYKPLESQFASKIDFDNLMSSVNIKGINFYQCGANDKIYLKKNCAYFMRNNDDALRFYLNGEVISYYTAGYGNGIAIMSGNLYQGKYQNFFAAPNVTGGLFGDVSMNGYTISTSETDEIYAMSTSSPVNVWQLTM